MVKNNQDLHHNIKKGFNKKKISLIINNKKDHQLSINKGLSLKILNLLKIKIRRVKSLILRMMHNLTLKRIY